MTAFCFLIICVSTVTCLVDQLPEGRRRLASFIFPCGFPAGAARGALSVHFFLPHAFPRSCVPGGPGSGGGEPDTYLPPLGA